jgi:hypothetical protein
MTFPLEIESFFGHAQLSTVVRTTFRVWTIGEWILNRQL